MPKKPKNLLFWLSLFWVSGFLTNLIYADLSSQELRDFNKKLTATDLRSIYLVTKEINERGETHQLFINGLRRYLKDESLPFRFFIAETLIKIGDNHGIEFFNKILMDPTAVRHNKINALNSLGNTRVPDVIPIIQAFANDNDRSLRITAIKNLLKCGVVFDATEMSQLYEECDSENKMILLQNLAEQQGKYMAVFILALSDKNTAVATIALRSLVKLADFGGIDTIYEKSSSITNKSVLFEAELILIEKGKLTSSALIDDYMTFNVYGRMLRLDQLKELQTLYPHAVVTLLDQIENIETDQFLKQRIVQLKNPENKTENDKQIQ